MKKYFLHSGHLGDCWCYINYLIYNNQNSTIKCVSPNKDRVEFYKKIYNLLDSNTQMIFECSNDYDIRTGKKPYLVDCFYSKTKKKYFKGDHIAYSFDASYFPDKKIPKDINKLIELNEISSIKKIKCGLPMSLEENVEILSNCKFYIGIDNGISHVARSVGCPMILIQHERDIEHAFPKKYCNYIKCLGTNEAEKIILKNI